MPANAKPQVNKTFRYQATAQDADDDILTYSLENNAATNVIIDSATSLVTWTPDKLGSQEFTIKVTDGKGGENL